MTEYILESRGRFWSADLEVPKGQYAPEDSVPGRLRVHKNGRAVLSLDASINLSQTKRDIPRMFHASELEGAICGLLFEPNLHVRLTRLNSEGSAFSSNGPIREQLSADRCLVSEAPFKPNSEPTFRWLDIPLDGYDEWVGKGHIQFSKTARRFVAEYPTQRRPKKWGAGTFSLELHHHLESHRNPNGTEVTWREHAFLRLGLPNGRLTVDEAIERADLLEDLLVIMADCDKSLDFGRLRSSKEGKPVQLYFWRTGRADVDRVQGYRVWVSLDACGDLFGNIVATWFEKREAYGPGVHLYLGNRRGQAMYAEHRFASLIWGLEALHRALFPPEPNEKQAAKVDRILQQIESTKDRKWAARFLPEQSEPALSIRLQDLFRKIDLGIDAGEIENFAQLCAGRRNDLSHYGGPREQGDDDAFFVDIVRFSQVIDLLYHALLLHLVGVPDWLIRRRFISAPRSSLAQATFKACGLNIPQPPDSVA